MENYARIQNNIVAQTQPFEQDGFVKVPLDVFAGMIANADGSFSLPKPQSQIVETQARYKREELLANSDWTQLPDAPEHNKQSWANYRQALRDVTKQSGFPNKIIWPNPPK